MQAARFTIVIDLAFGDCGKGTIVDYLARNAPVHTIVRFNGGPQAGHNVLTPDGRHHTFSQVGSGTLAGDSIATLLSRFMLVEPYAMLNEVAHLKELGAGNIWDRLSIDARCVIITPAHQAANRLRELARGSERHGSCGQGVGEAVADLREHPEMTLRAADLSNPEKVVATLRAVTEYKVHQLHELIPQLRHLPASAADFDTLCNLRWIDVAVENYLHVANSASILSPEQVVNILRQSGEAIFEGAQGVLLDQDFGFHPHTTWSRTTCANAQQLLRDAGIVQKPHRIGVVRSYFTRHGAGPFVTEDDRLRPILPETHNSDEGCQGKFRVGIFDAVAAKYAAEVSGVEELAVTHLDRISILPDHICTEYRTDSNKTSPLRPQVSRIEKFDLKQSEQFTRALFQCEPVFSCLPARSPDAFLTTLERELALPVRLMSFGPRASDKCIRSL